MYFNNIPNFAKNNVHLRLEGGKMKTKLHKKTKDEFSDARTSEEHFEKIEDNESESAEEDADQLRKELSSLPIADLLRLKEQVGEKMYNEVLYGDQSSPQQMISKTKKKFQRENKNRPMEMSSKKPVSRLRQVVNVKKTVTRDPRFDDLSGEFNETYFKQAYGFLSDIKLREKQKLLKALKKEKDEMKRTKLQQLLTRITQQEKAEREKEQRQHKEREIKKKERELIAEGKKPYFLKKSEKRKLELADKFKHLEESGKVDNYLAKRKKRNMKKDKKSLPASHE